MTIKIGVLLLLASTACSPQSTAKPSRPASPALMSPEFSKSALRALLAINQDLDIPETTVQQYINDASVEAVSPNELQVVKDLSTVLGIAQLNSLQRTIRYNALLQEHPQGNMDELTSKDPIEIETEKQDKLCQGSLETTLRARLYSPLPSACIQVDRMNLAK